MNPAAQLYNYLVPKYDTSVRTYLTYPIPAHYLLHTLVVLANQVVVLIGSFSIGSCSERQSDRPALHMQQMRPPFGGGSAGSSRCDHRKRRRGLASEARSTGFSLLASRYIPAGVS